MTCTKRVICFSVNEICCLVPPLHGSYVHPLAKQQNTSSKEFHFRTVFFFVKTFRLGFPSKQDSLIGLSRCDAL